MKIDQIIEDNKLFEDEDDENESDEYEVSADDYNSDEMREEMKGLKLYSSSEDDEEVFIPRIKA